MKLSIRKSDLQAALTCAASKDTRYYLIGVNLEFIPNDDGGILTFVGTDGHMMFAGTAPAVFDDGEQTAPFNIIIPSDAIKSACKNSGSLPCVTLAAMDDGRYILGDTVFTAIDGKYPDYRRIIPSACDGANVLVELR